MRHAPAGLRASVVLEACLAEVEDMFVVSALAVSEVKLD